MPDRRFRECRRLFHTANLRQFCFLAGAGVSVAAGLPSAWDFNRAMAECLATDAADADAIAAYLTTGYGATAHHLRFEQLMQVLRERIDPQLAILDCFEDRAEPGPVHDFLADALVHGARVLTTNFDSYIERAVQRRGVQPAQVYWENAANEPDRRGCRSFENYLARRPRPAVLKLHGSLRDLRTGGDVRASIGATLDRIGARTGDLRLEPAKGRALARSVRGRVLCVLGYSGGDDFDVVPTLAPLLTQATGLLWIRHEAGRPRVLHDRAARRFLPDALRRAAVGGPCVVVRGDTAEIVRVLFDVTLSPVTRSPADVAGILATIAPYARMRHPQRALIAARVAEEALDLAAAQRRYEIAATAAGRSRDRATQAFARFRLGHLGRVRGDGAGALRDLHHAERLYRRLRDRRAYAQVLNSIGNVSLERGDLDAALHAYRRALRSARASGHVKLEATVGNNIGLVWKKRGQYDRALEWYDRALELDQENRDRAGMARELGNRAAALLLLEAYEDALPVFARTIELARLLGREETVATALANRGIVYRHLRRYRAAEAAAHAALTIEQRLGRREGIARCYSLLGGVASSRGNYDDAIAWYRRAVRLQQRIGVAEGLAADSEQLGRALKAAGRTAAARTALARSRTIYARLGNERKAAELDELHALTVKSARVCNVVRSTEK